MKTIFVSKTTLSFSHRHARELIIFQNILKEIHLFENTTGKVQIYENI